MVFNPYIFFIRDYLRLIHHACFIIFLKSILLLNKIEVSVFSNSAVRCENKRKTARHSGVSLHFSATSANHLAVFTIQLVHRNRVIQIRMAMASWIQLHPHPRAAFGARNESKFSQTQTGVTEFSGSPHRLPFCTVKRRRSRICCSYGVDDQSQQQPLTPSPPRRSTGIRVYGEIERYMRQSYTFIN